MSRWPEAGFLTTSDHLGNSSGSDDGGLEDHSAVGSAFNIGYMYFNHSAMPLVQAWKDRMTEGGVRVWDVRARADAPALVARAYGDESTTSTSWSFFNPGLYNPVDRERTDLRRARDAGLITAAECEELEGMLDRQAGKPLLRSAPPPPFPLPRPLLPIKPVISPQAPVQLPVCLRLPNARTKKSVNGTNWIAAYPLGRRVGQRLPSSSRSPLRALRWTSPP
jgi:hypothetical protein